MWHAKFLSHISKFEIEMKKYTTQPEAPKELKSSFAWKYQPAKNLMLAFEWFIRRVNQIV